MIARINPHEIVCDLLVYFSVILNLWGIL